jgi:Toxin SymE, type I toxin-antitoxin system
MHRTTTVTTYLDQGVSIPMIRLRGKWLARMGFGEGQPVTIEVTHDGRLVLSRTDHSSPEPMHAESLQRFAAG